jgi:hypothetical protein
MLKALPALEKIEQVFMQFCRVFTFSCCTYDDAEIFGLDGFNDLLQPASFIRRMYFPGYCNYIVKGS